MKAEPNKSNKPQVNVLNNDNRPKWGFDASIPVKGGARTGPKQDSGGKFPPKGK